jgi:putative Mg2+ transporter-C (MgtC) family protein
MQFPFDLADIAHNLASVAISFALALPTGWDREKAIHTAGLRTFPLVAVTSCCYILVCRHAPGTTGQNLDRVVQGLITGIGFIGGGAIFKDGTTMHGTATAAAIWGAGALGAAVGCGAYDIAILLSVVSFATLRLLKPFKATCLETPTFDKKGR